MIKGLIRFKDNKMGSLSIEFAGVFFIYCALLFCIYDTYSSIMLQNKLERVTYSVASIFRERSALYELIDDTVPGNIDSQLSLCMMGPRDASTTGAFGPCYQTFELINQDQVEQAQKLAKFLLNKDVAVKIDVLFVVATSFTDLNDGTAGHTAAANIETLKGEKIGFSVRACPNNSCDANTPIGQYFDNLSNITDDSVATKDYFKLVPQVKRSVGIRMRGLGNLNRRWIPLYRVNMCVINEESLYLKLFNSSRKDSGMLPNLCHEVVVISRCNDLENPTIGCPIYNILHDDDMTGL